MLRATLRHEEVFAKKERKNTKTQYSLTAKPTRDRKRKSASVGAMGVAKVTGACGTSGVPSGEENSKDHRHFRE